MKNRNLRVLVVILSLAASAWAQSLTQADRDRAVKYLESTRQGVQDATADSPRLNGTLSRRRIAGRLPK